MGCGFDVHRRSTASLGLPVRGFGECAKTMERMGSVGYGEDRQDRPACDGGGSENLGCAR
jgi:hypothetical protein